MRSHQRALLAGSAIVAALLGGSGRAATAVEPSIEGRLTIDATEIRILDTTIVAGTDEAVASDAYVVVTVLGATADGTADLFPCGGAPSGDPVFRIVAGQSVARSTYAEGATCLRSTVPVRVTVDRRGSIDAVAQAGALQYHPLGAWEDVLVGAGTTTAAQFARGATFPAGDVAGTYAIAGEGIGEAGVRLYGCDGPTPIGYDLLSAGSFAEALTTIALEPGEQVCAESFGQIRYAVRLIGTAGPAGSTPDALPPTLTSTFAGDVAPGLVPVVPRRVVDTRNSSPIEPGQSLVIDLGPQLPAAVWKATAAALNVTVTRPAASGFLTVEPCPLHNSTSSINFVAGSDIANLVTVRLGAYAPLVCIGSSVRTDVLVDLAGVYGSGSGVPGTPVAPARILDTRVGTGAPVGRILAEGRVELQVAGLAGIPPSGVEAVTMNVTATNPAAAGYITAWPCDQPQPEASNLNVRAGSDVPNLVTVKLSAAGTVCLFSSIATHLLADVAAWHGTAGAVGYGDLVPVRVLDTRSGIGAAAGRVVGGSPTPLRLPLAGIAGVPTSGAAAVTMNVTVTNTDGSGYLTAWPCDEPRPEASNLNFVAGRDVANLVTVKLAADGALCLFSSATTDVLADVSGYWATHTAPYWRASLVS